MCSPHIMKMARERAAQQESGQKPNVSRRNFLKLGGVTAAGVALTPKLPLNRRLFSQEMSGEVIDLTHVFAEDVATYTGVTPTRENIFTVEEDGFFMLQWSFPDHTGTHLDAPAHFTAGGVTVDNLPPESLIVPAIVVDISAKAADEDDAMLTADDLMAWEADNGEIPTGALVCMYSGWEERWDEPETFRNADADGVQHYPGFAPDAATWLLENREIAGIGVDTLSLDIGASATFDVHLSILPAGKYGLENLKNLSMLMGKSATVMIGVPRYHEGSGGPCRVLAMT